MRPFSISFALILLLSACTVKNYSIDKANHSMQDNNMNTSSETNPLFTPGPLYFNYPPFDKIKDSHFVPAMEQGMREQLADIEAIVNEAEAPTFENTLIKMETSGQMLNRALTVFYSLISAHTNDALNAHQTEMAPKLSAHNDTILLNAKLFARIKLLYEQRNSLNLDA
ncbi:MAG: peptidyl-dipeptidase Dcp, partial [Planctomycetota bacterium]